MAKKKKPEEPSAGSPLWMATFADLMNLLLCFFVLLFAMSSVEESKFKELAESLSSAFNIFDNAGTSVMEDGELINLGTTQLNELGELVEDMGQASEEPSEDMREIIQALVNETVSEEEAEALYQEVNRESTQDLFNEFSEMVSENNLDGYLTLSIDPNGSRYMDINIDGHLLFDSGKVEIKDENLPIVSKIGDIIREFSGHRIEIIGHTDNVPIKTVRFPSNMELSSARASTIALYLADHKGMDLKYITWSGNAQYNPIASNSTEAGRAKNRRIEIRIYNQINS